MDVAAPFQRGVSRGVEVAIGGGPPGDGRQERGIVVIFDVVDGDEAAACREDLHGPREIFRPDVEREVGPVKGCVPETGEPGLRLPRASRGRQGRAPRLCRACDRLFRYA